MIESSGRLRTVFSWASVAEGISCFALFLVAMPIKYLGGIDGPVKVTGAIHGGLFLVYMLVLAIIFFKHRWSFRQGLYGFIAGILPFGTFIFDHHLKKSYSTA